MDIKETVNTYFSWIVKIAITLAVLSTLFLFSNLTTEFYDTPKFLILLIITGILLVLLAVKFTLNNKVVLIRTPLDIPLLLLLTVAVVSTVLSPSPYVALLGNQLKIHGSLISLAVYIIFYFVAVNSLRSAKEVRSILFILIWGGVILSVVTLLAYGGIKLLPAPWVHGINFTPTGSSFSTTAILALLIPMVASKILSGNTKLLPLILNTVYLMLFGITIALTGSFATWIAASLGLMFTLLTSRFFERIGQIRPISLISLIIPAATVVLVIVLSLTPPMGGAKNPLYTQAQSFPRETPVPFITSWKVAVSAFRDLPFWGTSPGTWLFNFTGYKPIEYNSSGIWNVRFDSAYNEYLQVLAILGLIGIIALLSLTALYITSAWSALKNHSPSTDLAISGLLIFILLALHPSTLILWVVGLLILACFYILNLSHDGTYRPFSSISSIKDAFRSDASTQTLAIDTLPSVLLTVFLAVVLSAFYFGGKFTLADYHHRKALNAVASNQGLIAYNELVTAEKLNPYSDLYHTDLAQTNFALANAIALSKGPTEASPAGSFTDQDKQNIQILLQQSINEGKIATTLSPRSALNWEILGLLYRQIAGVAQNALVFSLDSYGKAIFQDPLNPQLRLSVGGIYYAVKNYDLAIRFFTDSINLKPDFANGYYNLSVALRDKGDLINAQAAAEKVITLVEAGSEDYKIATAYLEDLKSKINPPTPAEPPAAGTSGALQNEKLPKVVNVGKPPENIATPPAVKKPNSTPEPTATP